MRTYFKWSVMTRISEINIEKIGKLFVQKEIGPAINFAKYTQGKWETATFFIKKEFFTDKETLFDLASLTKTFTATQILLLAKEKQLDLDAHPGDYLGFLKVIPSLRIADLLDHTSGLIYLRSIEKNRRYSKEAIFNILSTGLKQENYGRFNYTDLGYIYLGWIIEKVTNRHLATNLQLFCKDYGLPHTTYHSNLPKGKITFPTQRDLEPGEVQDEKARFLEKPVGHAGIFSSINDLMTYSKLWLENSFGFDQRLLRLALNGKNETEDFLNNSPDFSGSKIYPETYGYVWRRGRYYPHLNLRNHAGHTGCMMHLDFENKEALIYTTTFHYPSRSEKNKQRFLLWNWGIWNNLIT